MSIIKHFVVKLNDTCYEVKSFIVEKGLIFTEGKFKTKEEANKYLKRYK